MTQAEAEYRVLASLGKVLGPPPDWPEEPTPGTAPMSYPRALRLLIPFQNGSNSLWTKQHDEALELLLEHVQYQDYRIQSLKKQLYRVTRQVRSFRVSRNAQRDSQAAVRWSRASARKRILP